MAKLPADAVTTDLRTTQNELSVWKIQDESQLDDVFVALASNCDSIGTMRVVMISDDALQNLQIEEEECEGDTPDESYNNLHCNMIHLNYESVGSLAMVIIDCLKDKNVWKSKSRSEIRTLLCQAYQNNALDKDRLTESMRNAIIESSKASCKVNRYG